MPTTAFITVNEALSFSDINYDSLGADQIASYTAIVNAVCEDMEQHIGRPVVARQIIQSFDGNGRHLFLRHVEPGYLSVDNVVEDGITLTLGTDYKVYTDTGDIARVSGNAFSGWKTGPQIITVTYTTGVAQTVDTVPENLKLCAKIAFRFYRLNGDLDFGRRMEGGTFISPDKYPRQCLWLMERYRVPRGR